MDTDAQIAPAEDDQAATGELEEENKALSMEDVDLDEYLTGAYDYQAPKHGDIREGVVVDVNTNGVIMDIGFKREGIVQTQDLERLDEEARSEIEVGQTISVFVLRPSDEDGRPILSIHQASLYEDWVKAEQMMESGEIYEGEVSGYNRGGLIVKFGKIRGFVPASHVVGFPRRLQGDKRRERLEAKVGEEMGFKIIEVDRRRRRLILSQRRAYRAWQEVQRERLMEELEEGETRRGTVTSLTDFGAFVDLGGADGLIHVSELSWQRVGHPSEVLSEGDEIDVYVLNIDQERKRIALSLKKLQPDPWTEIDDYYDEGQLVEGRVTRVLDFGAFVAVDLGVEGLLHTREMIGTPELKPSDIVQAGDKLPVKIVGIDSQRRRLDLSAKQVQQHEWERWMAEQQAEETEEAEEAAETQPVETEAEASAPVTETAPDEDEAAAEQASEEQPPIEAEATGEEAGESDASAEEDAPDQAAEPGDDQPAQDVDETAPA